MPKNVKHKIENQYKICNWEKPSKRQRSASPEGDNDVFYWQSKISLWKGSTERWLALTNERKLFEESSSNSAIMEFSGTKTWRGSAIRISAIRVSVSPSDSEEASPRKLTVSEWKNTVLKETWENEQVVI